MSGTEGVNERREHRTCPQCGGSGQVPTRAKGEPTVHLRGYLTRRSVCGLLWVDDENDPRLADDRSGVTCRQCQSRHLSLPDSPGQAS